MKQIPALLLAHSQLPVTTKCRILKIKCKNGQMFGFANLDIDLTYDDGIPEGESPSDGPLLYRSSQGFTPARIASAAGTSVDNSDLRGLLADLESLGVTEEQVRSGLLDYADAWVYEINYLNLTTGQHEIIARGNCGRVTTDGEGFNAEFRALMQRLKQPLGEVTSVSCRAQFGDDRCGKAFTWLEGPITVVSPSEPDRIFRVASLANTAGFYAPGVVLINDGPNAGREIDVEAFAADGTFTLVEPLYFELELAVSISARQDCSKLADDADHGCLHHWAAERTVHFVGEPKLPLGQEGAISTPGAEI